VLEKGFTRDVREVGHWGTGDLEVVLRIPADFIKAKTLTGKADHILIKPVSVASLLRLAESIKG
jgi:hypothetical protein